MTLRFDKEAKNTLVALEEAMDSSVGIMDFLLRRIIDNNKTKSRYLVNSSEEVEA